MRKKTHKKQGIKIAPQYGELPPINYEPIAELKQVAGVSTEYLKECAKAHGKSLSDIRKWK